MTASGLWQDIGAGENFFTRLFRFIFLLAAAAAFCFLAILPLTWPQQAVLGTISLLMALAMASSSDSYLVTLTTEFMSGTTGTSTRGAMCRMRRVVEPDAVARSTMIRLDPRANFAISPLRLS